MRPFRYRTVFASTAMSVRRAAVVVTMGTVLSPAAIARAAPSYSVTLQGSSQTSASPLRQSFWTATPGVAPTIIDETAAAAPGAVGAFARLNTAWPFEIQTGVQGGASARAVTDDFVITGPANATTVQGAMWFRTQVRLDHGGGLAGSDVHRASVVLHVTAAQFQADGSCWSSNLDEGSDGVLAGHAPPLVDASYSLSGAFPVGVPFAVSLEFEAVGRTYGDSTVSPGITEADGLQLGVTLGDENGRVMELPPGYTVNAPSWRVVANVTSVAAGAIVDATAPRLAPAAPNPSAGDVVLGLTLPRSGEVTLVVMDLTGRVARRLAAARFGAGPHDEVWDGRRDSGELVAPGVYFAMARFENRILTRRVVRIR